MQNRGIKLGHTFFPWLSATNVKVEAPVATVDRYDWYTYDIR